MRDQYAGDVSDVLKLAFLRALAGSDRKPGIAWYYIPGHDGRPDGKHREWRGEEAWRELDEPLCAGLVDLPEHSIAALERAPIWPHGTCFHAEPVPRRAERGAWAARQRNALIDADIVFLDPDNGIGETRKHATPDEMRLLRRPGRAVACITFPGRNMPHDALVRALHHRLAAQTGAENIMTLRTSIRVPGVKNPKTSLPRERWFTLLDGGAELRQRALAFAGALRHMRGARVHVDMT